MTGPSTPSSPQPDPRGERLLVPELLTPRLKLRPHLPTDTAAIHDMRSQPGAVEYMTCRPPSRASTEATLRRYLHQNGWNTVGWTVLEREGGAFVGLVGILRIQPDNACAEMAYEVHRRHQQRGYAREAAQAALLHAFEVLELHRIELRIDPKNRASIRLAEALGFEREGHLRQHERHEDGRWLDSLIYALLAPETTP